MSNRQTNRRAASKPAPWLWIGAAVLVIGLAAGAFLWWQSASAISADGPLPTAVSVADAVHLQDAGAFVLDVRQPEEWVSYHIAGTTLIPPGEPPQRFAEVPRDKPIVVVCHSGNRSQQGRDILLNAGFTRVTSMTGGLVAWQTQGLPLATGQ